MHFRWLPIRWLVPIVLLSFTVVVAAGYWWVESARLLHNIEQTTLKAQQQDMHRSAVHIEYALNHHDWQAVQLELANLATEPGLDYALLLDTDNKVKAATRLAWVGRSFTSLGTEHPLSDDAHAVLADARRKMAGHVHLSSDHMGVWAYFPITFPAKNGNIRSDGSGVLLVYFDLSQAKQQALHALDTDVAWFIGALLLASLLIWGVSHVALTRRMRRIIIAAQEFARGRMNARAGLKSHDELGAISQAFDAMADKVEQSTRELLQLRHAIEQMAEALMITDADGHIEYVNPAFEKITGYPVHEVLGKTPAILKSGKHSPEFYQDFWQCISEGKPWSGTMTDRRRDGSLYQAKMMVTPIVDEQGHVSHYIAIQEDATLENKLQEQLNQAQKMESLGTLVGGIAHDFNNMLAGMLGNIHIAKRHVEDNPKLKRALERVDDLGYRAADMIKQLLAFARADPVEFKAFDLSMFVFEAAKLARISVSEDITFDIDVDASEGLSILGDSTQIQQMIMNLVNNARDAIGVKDERYMKLSLTRYVPDEAFMTEYQTTAVAYACLSVADSGEGIPADKLDNIFEPFFTTKPVGKGTGLGLSMIYGAMQRHNGIIRVQSELGKGTVFRLYFPLDGQCMEDAEQHQHTVAVAGDGGRLLLVDDEAVVREAVAEVLKSVGYQVDVACDGEQALQMFAEQPAVYHAVITDVVMPVMGGVESARKMRQIRADIPIVFATGYDREHVLSEIVDMQMVVALSKPVHPSSLQDVLARMC